MNEDLKAAVITFVNRKAVPTIYGAILQYKDGKENSNGALHINNITGLAEAGVNIEYDSEFDPNDPKNGMTKDELSQIAAARQRYLDYLDSLKKAQKQSSPMPES